MRRRPFFSTPVFVAGLLGITVLVVGLDLLTGGAAELVPVLIFLPAIVSGLGTVWQTAIASAWVLVVVASSVAYEGADVRTNLEVSGFTAAFGLMSIVGASYRIQREDEVRRLRSAAAALQRQLVRPLPLRSRDVVVDGLYQPIEEDTQVGGDMYEVAPSPYGTRVMIADVQGKGLPAIGAALAVLGAFREAAYRESTLLGVADALENAVTRHNMFAAHTGEPERFVTALLLDIGPELEVDAVNCGHIAPYLIHGGNAGQLWLGEAEVPLGLASLTGVPRHGARFAFPAGASLLLCTDGVTEARDRDGSFYPLESRLREWARDPPARTVEALAADLNAFTGGAPRDDIAVLILRRTGS
ncbi:MAG: serine/threonine-protein phosphatase [Nonomuraea sp.]|nr:serine/threonine-protein phosphatase [Nonomuraea sp.]